MHMQVESLWSSLWFIVCVHLGRLVIVLLFALNSVVDLKVLHFIFI